MNDLLSGGVILATGGFLFLVHAWILFYGGRNRLGRETGDEKKDRYTTGLVMLGLFAVVLTIHVAGLYRRVEIARGAWTGEGAVERFLDSVSFVPADDLTFLSGTLLVLAGVALRVCAVRTLGRLYTFEVGVRPDHRLVEHGPYGWIRHPAYSGYLLVLFGVSLSNAFSLGIIVSLALILVVYGLRIQNEEAVLLEHFGDAYRDYMRRTKRLVPYVV